MHLVDLVLDNDLDLYLVVDLESRPGWIQYDH